MDEDDKQNQNDQVAELLKRVRDAREQVVSSLVEFEDMTLRQNPRIEANYEVLVGRYETDLLKSDVAARRARRKLVLVRKAVMSPEGTGCADEEAIDAQLDGEFSEWDAKVKRAVARYYAMRDRYRAEPPNDAVLREMRELYRRLIRRLHPEVLEAVKPDERLLFLAAQMAYRECDVEVLRSIDAETANLPDGSQIETPEGQDVPDALYAEAVATEAALEHYREQVQELQGNFPYCYKAKLADPEWVAARVSNLHELIAQNERDVRMYTRDANKIIEAGRDRATRD